MYCCACCTSLRRRWSISFLQRHCSCALVLQGILLSVPLVLFIILVFVGIGVIHRFPCLIGQNNSTELSNAIKDGMIEKALKLLNTDKDEPDCNGETALQVAAFYGYYNVVEALIEHNSDINHQDHNSQTALIKSSIKNHIDVVVTLIDNGADLDIQDKILETALIHASWEGHVEVVKELTRCKASLNIRERHGETALFKAVWREWVNITDVLISAGIDVNAQDFIGETALYNAALIGNSDIVKLLTEQGRASICIADLNGKTPAMAAESSGHIHVAQYLRNRESCTTAPS